ncbi:MAG: L,D-transpeptidase [Hyphomicrobiales bacterium]|nr:L,D-transpeptidase [Hyphomicrobiales bacterium]
MPTFQRPVVGQSALFHLCLASTAGVIALASLAVPASALPLEAQPVVAPQRTAGPVRLARPGTTAVAARDHKPAAKESDDLAGRARGVHTVVVSIDKQQLTLYADGRPVAHSRVSTGQSGHATPTGVFSVIQKDRWHRSNLYANAPMYYMQRITWSGVAMHQGIVPNYPASHGCIRLPEAFARQMWGTTRIGARVIVTRSDVAPVPIAHAKLFTLKREPLEAQRDPTSAAGIVQSGHGAFDVAQLGTGTTTATDALPFIDPGLNAITYAMRSTRLAPATSSELVRSITDAAEKGTRTANLEGIDVKALKPGSVSVFISRKEGRLFVRKGFEPVFDIPVEIAQPEQPFGTHIYTALGVTEDSVTMRWTVISLPVAASALRKAEKGKKAVEPATMTASNAAQSLDRVTIPQDAADRISEMMSPGSSLIISDQGLGPETGKGTDFIVLTR